MKKLLILLFSLFTFVVKGQVNAVGIPFGMSYEKALILMQYKYGEPDRITTNNVFYNSFKLDNITYNRALFNFINGQFDCVMLVTNIKHSLSEEGAINAYKEAKELSEILKETYTILDLVELDADDEHFNSDTKIGLRRIFHGIPKNTPCINGKLINEYEINIYMMFTDNDISIIVRYSQDIN